jgi:hypothetical protein
MGETLIKALLEANLLSAAQIVATIKHASRVDEVAARCAFQLRWTIALRSAAPT